MLHPSRSNFTTVGVLVGLTLFLWTGLYGFPEWLTHDAELALQAEKQRLEEALQLAQEEIAEAHATPSPEAEANKLDNEAGFAYVFYATSDPYACSVLVNIHRLQNILHVAYPIHVLASSSVGQSHISAFKAQGVSVHIEEAPPLPASAAGYYQDCLLKLLAFKMQTIDPSLKRVLAFDSDQLIMRNLDHLFTGLPDVDLAAPRAYWLAKDFLASTFLMINVSHRLWKTVKEALDTVGYNKFDMDLINDLLGDQVMMLSGEYVTLNSHWEDWNLPKWYHPSSQLNLTTVELVNKIARLKQGGWAKRQGDGGGGLEEEVAVADASDAIEQSGDRRLQPSLFPTAMPSLNKAPSWSQPSQAAATEPSTALNEGPEADSQPYLRFPATHPLTEELYRLQDAAAVIHFTAQGKPWMKAPSTVQLTRPDAHPLLAEQFALWRETARQVCPGGVPGTVA